MAANKKTQSRGRQTGKKVDRSSAFKNKSLLERVGFANGKGIRPSTKPKTPDNSLRVVNGKLLCANDVGVLLRDAAKKTGTPPPKKSKVRAGRVNEKRRALAITRGADPKRPLKPYGNNLVISMKKAASSNFLRLRNLPLGTNSEDLKATVEQISQMVVNKVKLVDLPSGSVTAELWLQTAVGDDLEKVRTQFHNAEVDGRRISVEVASSSEISEKVAVNY